MSTRVRSDLRTGVILVVTAAMALGGCQARSAPVGQREARVGDRLLTVLLAGDDGMRGRSGFEGADGMLFDLGEDVEPRSVAFVMDGVAFPLDIAWFAAGGDLVGATTMAVCAATPCPTYAPGAAYRWAIEAPPGSLSDLDAADRLILRP